MKTVLVPVLLMFTAGNVVLAEGFPPQPARVDVVRMDQVQQRRFVLGELRAVKRSVVASRESGLVTKVTVEEGQLVKAGDTLATLDDRWLKLDLAEARESEKVAEAVIHEYQSEVKLRQWRFDTFKKLNEKGASREEETRESESALSMVKARIARAERELAVAKAKIARWEQRLADMHIVAPFDGRIVMKHTELGQWIESGGKVVELNSDGDIDAWFDVPEAMSQSLQRSGLKVSVGVEAAAGQMFESESIREIPSVHSQSKTYPLVVRLNGDLFRFKPGMTATAWVPTEEMVEQMTIDRDAILRNDHTAYVVAARTGAGQVPTAMIVPVTVVFHVGERVVIRTPNLKAGDLVVIEGNERLGPGTPLRIVGAVTAAKAPADDNQKN